MMLFRCYLVLLYSCVAQADSGMEFAWGVCCMSSPCVSVSGITPKQQLLLLPQSCYADQVGLNHSVTATIFSESRCNSLLAKKLMWLLWPVTTTLEATTGSLDCLVICRFQEFLGSVRAGFNLYRTLLVLLHNPRFRNHKSLPLIFKQLTLNNLWIVALFPSPSSSLSCPPASVVPVFHRFCSQS